MLHSRAYHRLLHLYVQDDDWVVHVDADEFVHFAQDLPIGPVVEQLEELHEAFQCNVYFGLLVDRVHPDGRLDIAPQADVPLAEQYPLRCSLVGMLQKSDVRKAVVYRGYLRPYSGTHQVIGLNWSLGERLGGKGYRRQLGLFEALRKHLGEAQVDLLPRSEDGGLYLINPVFNMATIYHFKWLRGLKGKMSRRFATEKYTRDQYAELRDIGARDENQLNPAELQQLCQPGPAKDGVMSAAELFDLFFVMKQEHLRTGVDMLVDQYPERSADEIELVLLERNVAGALLRETRVPVV